jgi:small-conductance mechanosensitive channel
MSIWAQLIDLVAASPFTGTWMSPATALVTLVVLMVARRMLPDDLRHHGRSMIVFLLTGFGVGLLRLGLVALGAGQSTGGVLLGFVTTFCVAMGAVGTAILVFLVLLPWRARLRVPSVVRDVVQTTAFVLIVFGVLAQSGFNVTSLMTTAGVLTAVVGLALQNTIANFFAGLMLHMDKELGEHDWVQVGTRTGQIVQVRWRSTLLRVDSDLVIIPNSQMLGNEVYNYSRPQARHRASLKLGFHYEHPPNQVRQMLESACRDTPGVLGDPAPAAAVSAFGDSAVVYSLGFWIESYGRLGEIKAELHSRIWYAARREGFEMPYATRTVHVVADSAEKRESARESDQAERLLAVERVDLFAPLEPAERAELAGAMKQVAFARGESIIRQGQPGDTLYIVAQGKVKVTLNRAGSDEDLAVLEPGHFFGEMSFVTGEPRAATCTALTDVVVYVVDHATGRKALAQRPAIADEMSAILAARQAELARKGDEMGSPVARADARRKRLYTRIREFFDLN